MASEAADSSAVGASAAGSPGAGSSAADPSAADSSGPGGSSGTAAAAGLVGRGIADITGEIAECGMLGYGMAYQQSAGLHTRLRARAFAFADSAGRRLMVVVCDLPLMFGSIVQAVLPRLPDGYTDSNVMLTATHTHCGPGGYAHHALYNGNTGGFRPQTFGAIVDGIVEAALAAHADLAPAALRLAHGTLENASANRSRRAFERNPADERAHFPLAVDPQTTVLTVERDGRLVGALNWFAVHNTSMTNQNRLVSADNKGYAGYHWERVVSDVDYLDRAPADFIAAFAQTNAGDMSPNLDLEAGHGPTDDMFENTRIIGTRQSEAAAALAEKAPLADPFDLVLDHRITYVDMADVRVRPEFTGDGRPHRTSGPAGGATSFAGALPDGPTHFKGFDAEQNRILGALSQRVVYPLSARARDAQAPKPIALPGGLVNKLIPLVQQRLPVQLLRIGPLYLIGLPFEVTITAGLRLRRTVAAVVGADVSDVLVAGYSNAYGHYTTTPEEYDAQMYEGGSTLFGRWQLPALQQIASELATAMRDGVGVGSGTPEPDLSGRRHNRGAKPPAEVVPPRGKSFGDQLSFARNGRVVAAEFVAAHPSIDLRRGSTYLTVERETEPGKWVRVADDGDWSTRLHWARDRAGDEQVRPRVPLRSRTAGPGRHATVRIEWDAGEAPPGRYRLSYHGNTPRGSFTGTTAPFEIG
ncbi:neutral/alkaline non-lysosomal ceramidase N-terminal domain-containing protein [Yinghuangia soli]|uniref:Neutral ceramidase n=1 Tax=Yinghuangia soli TaxID=2908204 RepID=A0AA41PVV4_9ACTN|nr:neutral/alkaline non-lysosomal ceramidase N-terminal domain-containing protein [Yinghuangia soli]MCF2525849.1 neutral/alkaline ceramidase [Yinghuangia soli]